jgi:hypothetical protein
MKHFDFTLASGFGSIGSGSVNSVDLTTNIVQGTDYNQRLGRAIVIRRIAFSGTLVGGQVGVNIDDAYNTMRFSFVRALPATSWLASTYNVSSVLDPRTVKGLESVVHDKIVCLSSPGVATGPGYIPATRRVVMDKAVSEPVSYVGTLVGTSNSTCLWLIAVSDSTIIPNPGFVSGVISIYFTDA